ncbi:MAG TPA: ParB/Srx family N-terminal domain-containing protein [Gammaproteobacteria bacterium]|nr:ParB/Srx family N-terminal domain-containing protein [Gammaproteobacteria bacterium]
MAKNSNDIFDYLPKCESSTPQGTQARLKLSQLRPTQNAVGMDEVNVKTKKIAEKSGKKLEDYLLQRTIPIIIGNGGQFYLIDHHHLAISLWRAKGDMEVPVEVTKNWSPITGGRFWRGMAMNNWIYPFDALGGGPTNPTSLKQHVKDLDNDIYRSLSWLVRQDYGYVKDPSNAIFAEFKWGSFFRTRVIFHAQLACEKRCMEMTLADIEKSDPDDYHEKVSYALYLASSPEASGLPGFVGRSG